MKTVREVRAHAGPRVPETKSVKALRKSNKANRVGDSQMPRSDKVGKSVSLIKCVRNPRHSSHPPSLTSRFPLCHPQQPAARCSLIFSILCHSHTCEALHCANLETFFSVGRGPLVVCVDSPGRFLNLHGARPGRSLGSCSLHWIARSCDCTPLAPYAFRTSN